MNSFNTSNTVITNRIAQFLTHKGYYHTDVFYIYINGFQFQVQLDVYTDYHAHVGHLYRNSITVKRMFEEYDYAGPKAYRFDNVQEALNAIEAA